MGDGAHPDVGEQTGEVVEQFAIAGVVEVDHPCDVAMVVEKDLAVVQIAVCDHGVADRRDRLPDLFGRRNGKPLFEMLGERSAGQGGEHDQAECMIAVENIGRRNTARACASVMVGNSFDSPGGNHLHEHLVARPTDAQRRALERLQRDHLDDVWVDIGRDRFQNRGQAARGDGSSQARKSGIVGVSPHAQVTEFGDDDEGARRCRPIDLGDPDHVVGTWSLERRPGVSGAGVGVTKHQLGGGLAAVPDGFPCRVTRRRNPGVRVHVGAAMCETDFTHPPTLTWLSRTGVSPMKCPIDTDADLVMSDRNGIEIDYCPKCRGVWLDRGELDKIIERASADMAPPPQAPTQQAPAPQPMAPAPGHAAPPPHARWDSSDRYYQQGYGYPKKRKSFLKEVFDF